MVKRSIAKFLSMLWSEVNRIIWKYLTISCVVLHPLWCLECIAVQKIPYYFNRSDVLHRKYRETLKVQHKAPTHLVKRANRKPGESGEMVLTPVERMHCRVWTQPTDVRIDKRKHTSYWHHSQNLQQNLSSVSERGARDFPTLRFQLHGTPAHNCSPRLSKTTPQSRLCFSTAFE